MIITSYPYLIRHSFRETVHNIPSVHHPYIHTFGTLKQDLNNLPIYFIDVLFALRHVPPLPYSYLAALEAESTLRRSRI
jgi:hypothetical protein